MEIIEIGTTQVIAASGVTSNQLSDDGDEFGISGTLESGPQSGFKAPKRTLWDDDEEL